MKNTLMVMVCSSALLTGSGVSSWNESPAVFKKHATKSDENSSPNAPRNDLKKKAIIGALTLDLRNAEQSEEYARDLLFRLADAADRHQQRALAVKNVLKTELQIAHTEKTRLAEKLQGAQSDKSKLETQLEDMRKAKSSMEAELEKSQKELLELKKALAAAPQAAASQLSQDIEQSLQVFMENFVTASLEDKKLQFEKCLEPLIASASQKAAEKTLIFIWAQLKERMRKVKGDYTSEDVFEITMLNEMTQSLLSLPGFDSLTHVQEKEQLSLEIEQDEPFYKAVIADLDKQLFATQLNIKECDALNPKSTQHRAIPVLLYLLKVNSSALLSMATFDASKWQQWASFVRSLTLDQRRALRFHLKQGNFPATFKTTQQKKDAIMVFLDSLQRSILENTSKRSMGQGDVAMFNTNLLGHLKWMMENRGA